MASVILFLSIILANIALKEYINYRDRNNRYQIIYLSVLSLVDKINSENIYKLRSDRIEGKINGLNYILSIRKVAAGTKRDIVSLDTKQKESFLIECYRVILTIGGKRFRWYKTEYRRLR